MSGAYWANAGGIFVSLDVSGQTDAEISRRRHLLIYQLASYIRVSAK